MSTAATPTNPVAAGTMWRLPGEIQELLPAVGGVAEGELAAISVSADNRM